MLHEASKLPWTRLKKKITGTGQMIISQVLLMLREEKQKDRKKKNKLGIKLKQIKVKFESIAKVPSYDRFCPAESMEQSRNY